MICIGATLDGLPGALAGDVQRACEKHGLPVVELRYRDRESNIERIRSADLGSSALAEFLRQHYSADDVSKHESEQVLLVNGQNEEFIVPSELKTLAMSYAGRRERLSDPDGYIRSVASFTWWAIPSARERLTDFFYHRPPDLLVSTIRPVEAQSLDFYGARAQLYRDQQSGKLVNLITVSNNPSESLPYLATLLVHELVHARRKLANAYLIDGPERALIEYAIVDEARAFDAQILAYLEGVGMNPELFCHWLYPSWSYGEIVVPLFWTMAAMESEAQSGSMIYNYARTPDYGSYRYLLNDSGTHLRPDLQEQIDAIGLRYVK